jgi:hypothetical protein
MPDIGLAKCRASCTISRLWHAGGAASKRVASELGCPRSRDERFLAAREAGLVHVPVIEANLNGDDPVVYMLRMASKRRHLTDDQRAAIADEEREWLVQKNLHERAKKARAVGGDATPEQKKKRLGHSANQLQEGVS